MPGLERRKGRRRDERPDRERPARADHGRHFDAATAPEWVDLITPNLKGSQYVEFPLTGHAVLVKSTCALSIMTGFLDNPTQPVDQTCAAQTALTFTTG